MANEKRPRSGPTGPRLSNDQARAVRDMLKQLHRQHGGVARALATRLAIDSGGLARLLDGRTNASRDTARRVARAAKVSLAVLLGEGGA